MTGPAEESDNADELLGQNAHQSHDGVDDDDGGGGDKPAIRKRKRHESEESEVPLEEMEDYIPTPPDGGWGWVIVASSLCCNMIVDGTGYSFGVLLLELMATFDEPKSKISMVGSLLCGVYLFAGPFVSAMTNRWGCRPVVIVGTIVATIAFVLASVAPNVDMLIITYGVMGGFGLGMVYLPAIVGVGYYFETKRAFATGLAVCGSGVGTFVFPPLTEFLLKQYAWRGTVLIIGALIFHGCVCGCVMRPLKVKDPRDKNRKPRTKNILDRFKEPTNHQKTRSVSECIGFSTTLPDETIREGLMAAKLKREKILQDNDSDLSSLPSVTFSKLLDSTTLWPDSRRSSSALRHKASFSSSQEESSALPEASLENTTASPDPPQTLRSSLFPDDQDNKEENAKVQIVEDKSPDKERKDLLDSEKTSQTGKPANYRNTNGGIHNAQNETAAASPLLNVPSPRFRNGAILPGGSGGSRTNVSYLHSLHSLHLSKRDLARPLYRKDIFYSGSILNIPQYNSQADMKSYIASITTIPGENDFVDRPSTSSKVVNSCCKCLPRSARDILSEMIDFSLFKDVSFMLICLGNIFAFLGFFVPFVFLVDQAVSLGVEKSEAAFLISIIGITNTIGRVVIGKIADLRIVDSLVITYASITLCGAITMLTPFCSVYSLLAVAAALFGFGAAAFISLSSIIICDRMGLDKLTNAFGLLSMGRGFAGMLGPPLAGYMYDRTQNYDMTFYISGMLLLAGALCHVFLHLPCLRPKHQPMSFNVEELDLNAAGTQESTAGSTPQIIHIEDISAI